MNNATPEELIEEILELTKSLVKFKTTADNRDQLMSCADFIENYFKDSTVFVKRYIHNNIPSLVVTLQDTTHPEILISTHFDVVPAAEEMFTGQIEGNKLIGRGTLDNKGPLATSMVLLKELSRLPSPPNIGIITTGDEEQGGFEGIIPILEQGIRADFALVLDGGSLNTYVLKSKGLLFLTLRAIGKETHGSTPWKGDNAIEKLFQAFKKIKENFTEKREDHWENSISLNKIQGGEAVNKVPSKAELAIDIRYTENDTSERILKHIHMVAKEIGGIEVEPFINEACFSTEENNPYVQRVLTKSKEVFGEMPKIQGTHGSSDARHLPKYNVPCILTYPEGKDHHGPREYLDLEKLGQFYTLLRKVVLNN